MIIATLPPCCSDFTWGKDNLTWRAILGEGIGNYISNSGGAVATNFGGALGGAGTCGTCNGTDNRSWFTTNRALYDANVSGTPITNRSAGVGYQHWWTTQLRSTADISWNHSDISTYYVQASGRTANNKELTLAHANLIWSPVAFLDLGVEGAWGHRVNIANQKGDAWTLQTSMKFRF